MQAATTAAPAAAAALFVRVSSVSSSVPILDACWLALELADPLKSYNVLLIRVGAES